MKSMLNKTAKNSLQAAVDKYAFWTVLATAIITIVFLSFIPNLKFENTPDKFGLPDDDTVKIDRDKFESQFNPGELIVIGLDFEKKINANDIIIIKNLSTHLNELDGIQNVKSIIDATEYKWIKRFGVNVLVSRPFLSFKRITDSIYINQTLTRLSKESIYKNILISEDQRAVSFILSIDRSVMSQIPQLMTLVTEIERIFKSEKIEKSNLHLAGTPVLNIALQEAMRRDLIVFAPVSILICVIVLIAVFRKWQPVAAGILTAAMSIIWTIGILPMTGTSMSLNLTMIVPVILSMSLIYSIHHLACIFIQSNRESDNTIIFCWRKKITPALICGLTTCLGFLALTSSRLTGIREVGIYIGLGVIISMFMANLFLPAMLNLFKWNKVAKIKTKEDSILEKLSYKTKDTVLNRPGLFVFIVLLLTVTAAYGLRSLNVETNHLKYLTNNKKITESFNFIDSRFGGVLPLEILVETSNENSADAINDILKFEERLKQEEEIGIVISAADFIRYMDSAKESRKGPFKPILYLDENIISNDIWNKVKGVSGFSNYLLQDDSSMTVRISSRVKIFGSERLRSLVKKVNFLTQEYLSDYQVTVTGLTPYFSQVEKYVISTQIISFSLALLVIIILLGLLSRNIRLGLIVMVVNFTPVVIVLGVMGWLDIPLDISTVMIASITLGIVVDDTIHLVYSFRKSYKRGINVMDSLRVAFENVGLPVIVSTIILFLSFSTLLFAQFIPTVYFGGLAALTILIAWVADLLLLPALIKLLIVSPKNKR